MQLQWNISLFVTCKSTIFWPECPNLGQAWLEWQTQTGRIVSGYVVQRDLLTCVTMVFSCTGIATRVGPNTVPLCLMGIPAAHKSSSPALSCSKWGVRFISLESTHGVVLMKEPGEIKQEVEMSLRTQLWSVGSPNTMWIKMEDSQQGPNS